MSQLRKEIEFFEACRAELVEKHSGEYVLVKDAKILGFFETEEAGLEAGYKLFAAEPFLLRKVADADTPVFFTSLYLACTNA